MCANHMIDKFKWEYSIILWFAIKESLCKSAKTEQEEEHSRELTNDVSKRMKLRPGTRSSPTTTTIVVWIWLESFANLLRRESCAWWKNCRWSANTESGWGTNRQCEKKLFPFHFIVVALFIASRLSVAADRQQFWFLFFFAWNV